MTFHNREGPFALFNMAVQRRASAARARSSVPCLLVLREQSVNLPTGLGSDGKLHGTLEPRVSQIEPRAGAEHWCPVSRWRSLLANLISLASQQDPVVL